MELHIFFVKDFIYFIFRQRGREGEREGEKYQCVVDSSVPPIGDLAGNPSMCPDWEWSQQPFGSPAGTSSTEPHQPGWNYTCSYATFWKSALCMWASFLQTLRTVPYTLAELRPIMHPLPIRRAISGFAITKLVWTSLGTQQEHLWATKWNAGSGAHPSSASPGSAKLLCSMAVTVGTPRSTHTCSGNPNLKVLTVSEFNLCWCYCFKIWP